MKRVCVVASIIPIMGLGVALSSLWWNTVLSDRPQSPVLATVLLAVVVFIVGGGAVLYTVIAMIKNEAKVKKESVK